MGTGVNNSGSSVTRRGGGVVGGLTGANAFPLTPLPSKVQEMDLEASHADAGPSRPEYVHSLPEAVVLEDRIRMELLSVGLLDADADIDPFEDDEVCVELRNMQRHL